MEYKIMVTALKTWLREECVAQFVLTAGFILLTEAIILPPIILYSYLRRSMWTTFWLAYLLWTWFDSHRLKTDGRKWHRIKYARIFHSIRDYYPLRLIKTVDLAPDRNYVFACFPHAIITQGAIANFCTDINKVTELFPKLDIRCATLSVFFHFPLAREIFMALGGCTTDETNLKYLLSGPPSKAVVIFPGGMKEGLSCRPGNEYKILKTNRRGFVRIALQTGAPLVPVFSFGEQNTLDQEEYKSSTMKYLFGVLYKFTRVKLNFIKGRGIFPHWAGFFPHRRPINTVVGEPIPVPKTENPTAELIDEYHKKFYQAIDELFTKYKCVYDEAGNDAVLTMI